MDTPFTRQLLRRGTSLLVILLAMADFLLPQRSLAAETSKATFAAGCFWCMELIYEQIPGVTDVVSGYAGGKEENPTYKQVGSGKTGHAETIQITFDPGKISFEKLVDIFWKTHDATDPRGVEPDFGKQYRSVLFYHDEAQRAAVEKSKAEAQKGLNKPIATEVVAFDKFWPAEDYHQDYARKNPRDAYVRKVSIPRMKKVGLPELKAP